MVHALSSTPRLMIVLGAVAALGAYALGGDATTPVDPSGAGEPVSSSPRAASALRLPRLVAIDTATGRDDTADAITDDEPVRGHAPIEDLAELALVFAVDGESYLRLSSDERASSRGTPRMTEEAGVFSVVAPVATSALPAHLRSWAGRTVLVEGSCRARVIGFAEVSRVAGDPPGSDHYYYDDDDEAAPAEEPRWTVEDVVASNVVLAAQLDGCTGTWARGEDYSPAAVVMAIEEPALEQAAVADLLARGEDDSYQQDWTSQGGEGDWRDAVDVATHAYQHPLTGERWIFAQARHAGGCGDPSIGMMAAYRVTADGAVRRFAELDFGYETVRGVVDLDGDGQPELLLGDGDTTELVDLANERHASISVEHHFYGCGC
jgi:hypothetical protein